MKSLPLSQTHPELSLEADGWNEAWHKYDAAKVSWGDANVAIIKNWDPSTVLSGRNK